MAFPKNHLDKLRVQYTAACLITGNKRLKHMQPVQQQLHWLPIPNHINFKLRLITCKALNKLAPRYIKDLLESLTIHNPGHNPSDLCPRIAWKYLGKIIQLMVIRCFSFAALKLWNQLPECLKTSSSLECFKKDLKAHLFNPFTTKYLNVYVVPCSAEHLNKWKNCTIPHQIHHLGFGIITLIHQKRLIHTQK